MKVAIGYSTKDRTELTRQTAAPLLQDAAAKLYDLFWFDGSVNYSGEALTEEIGKAAHVEHNVRGGADAAIVHALTKLLRHPNHYDYIGLCENDVLLHPDWFGPTFALFARGQAEGLNVGAVSPRCYEDRILVQRDGYALCHNLGAGIVIFTRQAALALLDNYRTGWTLENRRIFAHLSGLDIGKWWCFRGGEHWITADWSYDAFLAGLGYASLALTPTLADMIGQTPTLAEQGLRLAKAPVELLRNDKAFNLFVERARRVALKEIKFVNETSYHQADDGSWTYFPHQIPELGGKYAGDWRLKWAQGFGPFAYRAGSPPPTVALGSLTIPVAGPCTLMVSGGENGGQVRVEDESSGYHVAPQLAPEGQTGQVMQLSVPASVSYREVKLTALTEGIIIYGMQTREAQAWLPGQKFDRDELPPI